jgi:hypothetical protein
MKRIAVLITVAPEPPYPRLFSEGPSQTWLNDLDEYSDFYTYSGLKMSRKRKMISDLRDCIRFPGRLPQEIGTTNPDTVLMVAYSKFINATHTNRILSSDREQNKLALFIGKVTRFGISATNRVLETGSRLNGLIFRTGRLLPCNNEGNHLFSPRLATMTNHTRIQRDVLSHLFREGNYDGVLFCTASVFIDWKRFRVWIEDLPINIDFASVRIPNSTEWSYGGTVAYFSKRGVHDFTHARNLDYALLQDLSIGKWLSASIANWSEIPSIKYEQYPLDANTPVTEFPVAIICTNHRDRLSEANRMKELADSITGL